VHVSSSVFPELNSTLINTLYKNIQDQNVYLAYESKICIIIKMSYHKICRFVYKSFLSFRYYKIDHRFSPLLYNKLTCHDTVISLEKY